VPKRKQRKRVKPAVAPRRARDAEFTVLEDAPADAERVVAQRLGAEPLAPAPRAPRPSRQLRAPVAVVRERAFWVGMASTVGVGLLAAGLSAGLSALMGTKK
jgi:hypothetical protein